MGIHQVQVYVVVDFELISQPLVILNLTHFYPSVQVAIPYPYNKVKIVHANIRIVGLVIISEVTEKIRQRQNDSRGNNNFSR